MPPVTDNPILTGSDDGVYITNEGNFQFGNAAVSYYEEGLTDAIPDLFEPANARPLGDVCQSMYFFNEKAYLVVNNSNKIEVVDEHSFVSISTITGFNSPRYFLPVSNSKAYVTDLFDDAISIVNLSNHTRVGEIPIIGWTEEMALSYGNVFVTNRQSDQLYIINSLTDAITDSISIGYGANSIVEDRNGKLWVLCSGHSDDNINASLHRINPIDQSLEETFTFDNSAATPGRLNINGSLDTLYYLSNDVFQMPISSPSLPTEPLIPAESRNFYGLGIRPKTGDIFIADAIDFVQRGKVYVYQSNGELIQSFFSGIIPGDFYFE